MMNIGVVSAKLVYIQDDPKANKFDVQQVGRCSMVNTLSNAKLAISEIGQPTVERVHNGTNKCLIRVHYAEIKVTTTLLLSDKQGICA